MSFGLWRNQAVLLNDLVPAVYFILHISSQPALRLIRIRQMLNLMLNIPVI